LELDQRAQATKADEGKLSSLLSSRIEVAMGPPLMTGGLLIAVAAYLSGMPQPLPTAISMVGLTVAMVGGASEISFLLAASRAADIVSGTKGTTGLLRVLGVAALIGLYMVVVGIPLVGLYVLRIAARAGVKRGQLLSGLLPLYSLLTLGLIISASQLALATALVELLAAGASEQGAPQPLGSEGQQGQQDPRS